MLTDDRLPWRACGVGEGEGEGGAGRWSPAQGHWRWSAVSP